MSASGSSPDRRRNAALVGAVVPALRRSGLGVSVLLAWTAFWSWRMWRVSGLSWHFFADGGRLLFHGSGLSVYAEHPVLQVGPLSLITASALRALPPTVGLDVTLALMTGVGLLLLAALAPMVDRAGRGRRLFLAAIVVMPAWTVLSVRWGHLDDVLAMSFAILALRAVHADRPYLAGAALAAAVASKPWAIGFLPVMLGLRHGRARALAAAALGVAAAWGPFLLANPGTLAALRPPVAVTPSSALHFLGFRGTAVPWWGRSAQLVLAPLASLAIGVTRRLPGVLLVAIAVRLALDPLDNGYYIGAAAMAAAVFDLIGTRWRVPWTTIGTVIALWQPFARDNTHRLQTSSGLAHWWFAHPGAVGGLHVAWSVSVLAVVVLVRREPKADGPKARIDSRAPDAGTSAPTVDLGKLSAACPAQANLGLVGTAAGTGAAGGGSAPPMSRRKGG